MGQYRIVVTTPSWSLNGVNTFTAWLAEGMRERGVETDLLITMPDAPDDAPMEIPPFFNVTRLKPRQTRTWPLRWAAVREFIASRGPCIYLPSYDFRHSSVSGSLPPHVGIVGILHSDDPLHYDHFERIGLEWNATVGVSQAITAKTRAMDPEYAGRMTTIPYGVRIPEVAPARTPEPGAPLRIVYAGRLVTHQKRIFDLISIMEGLDREGTKAELTMIGGGAQREEFERRASTLIERGIVRMAGVVPNEQVMREFERSDVFILTSDFEGLSVSLLEAMGRGCVPVVTDIESGTPELIKEGFNGARIAVGDTAGFVACLRALAGDRGRLAEMGRQAFATVDRGGFRTQDMVARYAELFDQVLADAASGAFVRPGREPVQIKWLRRPSRMQRAEWMINGILHRLRLNRLGLRRRLQLWRLAGFIKHNTVGRAWWFYDWARGRRERPW